MATTHDKINGGGESAYPFVDKAKCYVLKNQVDFDDDFTTAVPAASGDSMDIFSVKADCLIALIVERETAEGGTATIDVTTTETSAQTILDNADINGTGTLYGDGADGDATLVWFYVASACNIRVLFNNALDNAVVTFRLVCIDMSGTPVA